MELRIVKPSFKYVAGQWLFLQVPEISKFQWHPVSLSQVRVMFDVILIYV
jgi:NADPH oxidase 1